MTGSMPLIAQAMASVMGRERLTMIPPRLREVRVNLGGLGCYLLFGDY